MGLEQSAILGKNNEHLGNLTTFLDPSRSADITGNSAGEQQGIARLSLSSVLCAMGKVPL